MSSPFVRRLTLIIGAALAATSWVRGAPADEPLAVVVSPSSPVTNIEADILRRIFLERPTKDPSGTAYVALNHPRTSSYRVRFDQAVLRMGPTEVQRYWIDQKIRGVRSPRVVDPNAIGAILARTPGGVSYVPVTAAKGLRVVTVDGKGPGTGGYLLR